MGSETDHTNGGTRNMILPAGMNKEHNKIGSRNARICLDLPIFMVYNKRRDYGLNNRNPFKMYGADGRSRTACLLITNQLLYQLSYVG